MALANILCRGQVGIDVPPASVEIHVDNSMPTRR